MVQVLSIGVNPDAISSFILKGKVPDASDTRLGARFERLLVQTEGESRPGYL